MSYNVWDDKDLVDHGAIPYDNSMTGEVRDLPDVDLSDHGAVPYATKTETWGTNDEDIIKQIDILMHASACSTVNEVMPLLNADSLAKIVEYRYRERFNSVDNSDYGISKEKKEELGTLMFLDFYIIESMINNNPNCFEPIFDTKIYMGQEEKTDVFGVIDKYQEILDKVKTPIPMINGMTDEVLTQNGQVITAQDEINYLKSRRKSDTDTKVNS